MYIYSGKGKKKDVNVHAHVFLGRGRMKSDFTVTAQTFAEGKFKQYLWAGPSNRPCIL